MFDSLFKIAKLSSVSAFHSQTFSEPFCVRALLCPSPFLSEPFFSIRAFLQDTLKADLTVSIPTSGCDQVTDVPPAEQ